MSLSPLKRGTHYSSVESLSLPRRQRVFDTQLVPAGDALPIWNSLPLDSKLPVVPSPKGSYTLYTTPVGMPMYIHKQHYDFDLNNSLYAKPGEYDSLHDPFLKDYFYKPRTKRLLVNNDLITKDGKVKCDIKEFNDYRSYLRYRSVTELSLQRSGDRVEESWLPGPVRAVKTTAMIRTKPNSLEASRTSKQRDDASGQLDPYGRDVSLVQRMRMREATLLKRMTDKERERVREHNRRIKESWQSRKQRQERILQHEEEIDKKVREDRARQVLHREKTLARQRDRVIAKFGHSNKGGAIKGKRPKDGNKGKADQRKGGSGDEKPESSPEESPRGQERDDATDNA